MPLQHGVNEVEQHALERLGLKQSNYFQGSLLMLVDQAIRLFKNASLAIQLFNTINAIGFTQFTFMTGQ